MVFVIHYADIYIALQNHNNSAFRLEIGCPLNTPDTRIVRLLDLAGLQ